MKELRKQLEDLKNLTQEKEMREELEIVNEMIELHTKLKFDHSSSSIVESFSDWNEDKLTEFANSVLGKLREKGAAKNSEVIELCIEQAKNIEEVVLFSMVAHDIIIKSSFPPLRMLPIFP